MQVRTMRCSAKLANCVAALLFFISVSASADPMADAMAQRWGFERLAVNPDAHDRVDQFCWGKRLGDSCSIPGSVFAGGGDGACRSEPRHLPSTDSFTIDRVCLRAGTVVIDRGLPRGGYLKSADECARPAAQSPAATRAPPPGLESEFTCELSTTTVADRFCASRNPGDACMARVSYQGRNEDYAGICRAVVEKKGYYDKGRHTAERNVLRCEPPQFVEHIYAPVKRQ